MSALSSGDSHRMLIRAPRGYVPSSADFVVGRARMIRPVLAVTTPGTAAPNASVFAWVAAPPTYAVSTDAGIAATAPCSSHARPRLTAPRTSDENIILCTDNHHTFRSSPATKGDMERTPHMPSATTP
jgi:hypothetical protein